MKRYFVYILRCKDNSYYVGMTNDLERRLGEHVSGILKHSYTYSRRPVELVFFKEFSFPMEAIAFEKKLKGWSRKKKEALIDEDWKRLKEYSTCKNSSSHKFFNRD